MDPVRIQDLINAVGGQPVGIDDPGRLIRGVSTDSRSVEADEAFWALPGQRYDGHDFVDSVQDRAAVSLIEQRALRSTIGPRIAVPDSMIALADFAGWYRSGRDALVIGITGSVGKTTTRRVIYQVLSGQFSGTQSPASFNNSIGVPLTLLQIQEDDEFAAVELGTSAPGEIAALADLAQVEIGVVTAVTQAHLSGLGSLEAIVREKGDLLERLPPSGLVVLGGDDQHVAGMQSRTQARAILVGEGPSNDFRAREIHVDEDGLRFMVGRHDYFMPVLGRHHVIAGLSAIALAEEFGMKPRQIAERLADYSAAPGRCQHRQIGPWTVIDDSYNSNPGSLRAACKLMQELPSKRRRIFISGDMLELGSETESAHRQAGRDASLAGLDHLIVFGDQARHVIRGAIEQQMARYQLAECSDIDALKITLECWLEPGDIVLVKGSRGLRMERIIELMEDMAARDAREWTAGSRLPAVA